MAERPAFYLPDFCRAQSVLAVILIAALVAILITLARHGIAPGFWSDLARVSLFLLWAALGTAAAWCAARGLLSGSTCARARRSRSPSRSRSPRS